VNRAGPSLALQESPDPGEPDPGLDALGLVAIWIRGAGRSWRHSAWWATPGAPVSARDRPPTPPAAAPASGESGVGVARRYWRQASPSSGAGRLLCGRAGSATRRPFPGAPAPRRRWVRSGLRVAGVAPGAG
jgi:hypothetical protein